MSTSDRPSPRRVLITGGFGFVGRRLGELLADRGHAVTLVDSHPPPEDVVLRHGITAVCGDVTDPGAWARHLTDVDVVVHCAAIHLVTEVHRDPERATHINVGGTRAVLDGAIRSGVERFVLLSTSKVYGDVADGDAVETDPPDPVDHYASTKVACEALCAAAHDRGDIDAVVVRPFSVYGPHQDVRTGYVGALVCGAVADEPVSLSGDPKVTRDFVHIDTVADLLVAIVEAPSLPYRVWNAGSGRATTLAELVRTFVEVTGFAQPVTYRTPNPGTVMRTSADMTRARELIGDIDHPLSEGIAETLATHRRAVERGGGRA